MDKSIEKRLIKSRGQSVLSAGRVTIHPRPYTRALAYWPNSRFVFATRSEQINPIVYARGHSSLLPFTSIVESVAGGCENPCHPVHRRYLLYVTHKMGGLWVSGVGGRRNAQRENTMLCGERGEKMANSVRCRQRRAEIKGERYTRGKKTTQPQWSLRSISPPPVPVHKICRALSRAVRDVFIIISTRPSVNGGGGNERKNKSSSPSSTTTVTTAILPGPGGRTSKISSEGHRHRKFRYKRARLATWVVAAVMAGTGW